MYIMPHLDITFLNYHYSIFRRIIYIAKKYILIST